MNKILILLASFFFYTLPNGFAQSDFREGFIITNQLDTLYGEIDYRTRNQQSIDFRLKKGNQVKEYAPSQIVGYRFLDDTYFSSQKLDFFCRGSYRRGVKLI